MWVEQEGLMNLLLTMKILVMGNFFLKISKLDIHPSIRVLRCWTIKLNQQMKTFIENKIKSTGSLKRIVNNTKKYFEVYFAFNTSSYTSLSFIRNALKLTQVSEENLTGFHLKYFSHIIKEYGIHFFQHFRLIFWGMHT